MIVELVVWGCGVCYAEPAREGRRGGEAPVCTGGEGWGGENCGEIGPGFDY